MTTEISSANNLIIDKGAVITFDESADLTFYLHFDETFSFNLVFRFLSDNSGKRSLLKEIENENTVVLKCTNFNNPFWTGTTKPIDLATFNGKKIYMNFWLSMLNGTGPRQVTYSIYSER